MTLYELVSNYLFNKHPELLADGVTADSAKTALAGLETVMSGLSEQELTSVVESTKTLQSFTDKKRTEGIETREKALKSEYEVSKRDTEKTINQLKSKIPLSADPAELRKLAETEADDTKRTILLLKADNIENKQSLEEQRTLSASKDSELKRERLLNLAKSSIGDRKIPKSLKIESFLGATEEETTANVTAFNTEWDDFTKDMKTASVITDIPGSGDSTEEKTAQEKLDNMSFLD